MKKFKIGLGVFLFIVSGILIFKLSPLYIKENYTIVDSNKKTITDNKNKVKTTDEINANKDLDNKNYAKNDSSINNNVTNKNKSNNNSTSNDDYSVLVQSPIYDAVVQLDKDSKEIKVKVLDDSNIDSYDTDKYINLSEEDVNYLKENANTLVKEFEDGSLLDKYSFVTTMLKEYDTNINMGDLINIAMTYLK